MKTWEQFKSTNSQISTDSVSIDRRLYDQIQRDAWVCGVEDGKELVQKQSSLSALMCENADLKAELKKWKMCAATLSEYAAHKWDCKFPEGKDCKCKVGVALTAFDQLTGKIIGTGK